MYTMIDSEFIRYAVGWTELHRVTINELAAAIQQMQA